MSYVPVQDSFSVTGSISGNGQEVVLDAPGCSGGILTIEGTFQGTLTLTGGTIDGNTVEGGRLMFRSGVGSTGRNRIVADQPGAKSQEYRFVAGGDKVFIRGSNWVSGTVNIRLRASKATTTVFNNGPINTPYGEATRDSRAFAASTGIQSVAAGNQIAVTLKNPTTSGRNVFIKNRIFGNNRSLTGDNLEYVAYGDPTIVPTNLSNGINTRGVTPFSNAEFRWQVGAGLVMGGTLGTGEILPNGAPYTRALEFVLAPGSGVGFLIQGAGNNIANAVRLSLILEWYEEDTF